MAKLLAVDTRILKKVEDRQTEERARADKRVVRCNRKRGVGLRWTVTVVC